MDNRFADTTKREQLRQVKPVMLAKSQYDEMQSSLLSSKGVFMHRKKGIDNQTEILLEMPS